jgi:hypothetical protein
MSIKVALLTLLIVVIIFLTQTVKKQILKNERLNKFNEEKYYDIHENDEIKSLVKKIVEEEKSKNKSINDYIRSVESGLVRGFVIGFIMGEDPLTMALMSGGLYSLINPLMLYIGY